MAVDLTTSLRNNETRNSKASVATLAFNLPKGAVVTTGTVYEVGIIPAGALVTSINAVTVTAFDSATSAVANVGIGASATAIKSALPLKATAGTVVVGTGTGYYAASELVTMTPTIVGATTVGETRIVVEYIMLNERTGSFAG
jgi:hypothetical protein